ncbi:MAG TPA: DUF1330 domain-containing protein [Candidatus Dormibacteraeota bacterium]|jgi:uncharacterized protein (DUF1330 family)
MPAYVIANLTITNPEGFDGYRRQVPAVIEQYGGRYLVRGGSVEIVEGDWPLNRFVVVEFPSMEQAKRWYESEEYGAIKSGRTDNSEGQLGFVEGVPAT